MIWNSQILRCDDVPGSPFSSLSVLSSCSIDFEALDSDTERLEFDFLIREIDH